MALAMLTVSFVSPAAAQAENGCGEQEIPPDGPETTQFFNNDPNLGPQELPSSGPVAALLKNYKRFGDLSAAEFEQKYLNTEPKQPGNDGTWKWPPGYSGFDAKAGPPFGNPSEFKVEVIAGQRLDRFGRAENGFFLARAGLPFHDRALPPSSLRTYQHSPEASYHVYCVAKPFLVDTGKIMPWFEQTGFGLQFWLNPKYMVGSPATVDVAWLLANGYLVEKLPK